MNRTRFALAPFTFVLVTAFAAAAWATPSVGTLEISGGYAKSSLEAASPFSTDSPSGGISFGAGYFRSIAPKTSWGIEAAYDNLGSIDWTDGTDNYTSSVSMVRVTPEFRMNFGAPVGPSFFAQAGGGYYGVSVKEADNTTSTELSASDGKFGFNFGAGVGFPMGPKTKLNIQGNYHSVSTEGQSTNYLGFRAGLALNL
ncbi:MAG: porin family protein [Candidatus Eisenbacteria bacterium]|uniref:Porin family protein n=1 Tax=Eiseniibacteriota bacterium TaxID=2212470 RepID=A0A538T4K2_UNCEI|nr:MAG: porin family protein [Candidatus Eisenbacteria bacterium]